MIKKLFKKILSVVVTLLLVSVISFLLMANKQGEQLMSSITADIGERTFDRRIQNSRRDYALLAQKHHLDLPAFYFSIRPHGLYSRNELKLPTYRADLINKLSLQYGSKDEVLQFFSSIDTFVFALEDAIVNQSLPTINASQLMRIEKAENVQDLARFIQNIPLDSTSFLAQQKVLIGQFQKFKTLSKTSVSPWPTFKWQGANNRYHNGIVDLFTFNWGRSFHDNRLIKGKIGRALIWTLFLSSISLFLIFLISIPLGIYQALNNNTRKDKWITSFLFFWYTVPMFWLATLFIIFLTSDYYSSWLNIFEGPGLGNASVNLPFFEQLSIALPHLILPIICMVLPSIAYVSQQMKTSFLGELNKEYVLAARAQGVSEKKIIWSYILPNSLFPIYTILGYVLPTLIAGSLVIEIIFNIPGMGRLAFESINYADWPLLNVLIMLNAFLTIVGFLISDALYYIFDPRVRTKTYDQ